MYDIQNDIFRWASYQTLVSAVSLFAVGLLLILQGFRFARFLLAGTCGAAGFVLGGIGAAMAGLPPFLAAATLGGLLGALALLRYSVGLVLSMVFLSAALAHFITAKFVVDPMHLLIADVIGAAIGLCFKWINFRAIPIISTTIQGAALLIVAFVGIASGLAPSLASTFVEWGDRIPLMIPLFMTMLFVLGYSVQANMQQGDMLTGAGKGWNSAETA